MHARSFWTSVVLLTVITGTALSGCRPAVPQVVKIGFVAPFEGRYREIGVDTIPAARLAIRDWALSHPDSSIVIELIAYDDAGDPERAADQARKLIQDPGVQVVIGHWRDDTTIAALATYSEAGIPVITYVEGELPSSDYVYNLAPSTAAITHVVEDWVLEQDARFELVTNESVVGAAGRMWSDTGSLPNYFGIGSVWGLSQFYSLTEGRGNHIHFASGLALPQDMQGEYWTSDTATQFDEAFKAGSLGAPPGIMSAAAYEATLLALDLLGTKYRFHNTASAATVIKFDASGRRIDSPIYLYQWSNGQRIPNPVQP
jgi:ABC-type branched-subunit amino acid transport system substrate-binding protein